MSTREVISSAAPLRIICEANKQHGGGGASGPRGLSLSLLRSGEKGDLVNCSLILMPTGSQPQGHEERSQGLVGRFGAAEGCWARVSSQPWGHSL